VCACVCVFVCSLSYAMCMRHTDICGLPDSTIFFPNYFLNGTIFEKQLRNIKCVFQFSLQLLPKHRILRSERGIIKNVHRSSCKVPVIIVQFNETLIFFTGFRKTLNIKFHENLPSANRVVPCGQTDVQT
jgi:hypothetical protein